MRDIELILKYDGVKSQLKGKPDYNWTLNIYPAGEAGISLDEYRGALSLLEWARVSMTNRLAHKEREATRSDRILAQLDLTRTS